MWSLIRTYAVELLKHPAFAKVVITAIVAWFVTAGGCSLTARVSTAWAKRQAYKQGYREGKATCEADGEEGEQRRWRLFSAEPDPVPAFGQWYGATDDYCIDGDTIEVEPTAAERE